MSNTSLNILAIEPYMTGSHRSFLEGLRDHSRHDIEIWGMPGRKWKWRMRASAISFARQLDEAETAPDVLFVSDYLDVAAFKALLPQQFREVPLVTYFHENQLTYPVQDESERDYQFVFTNITSCLASDAVWFNSRYHMEAFIQALPAFFRRMPDHVPEDVPQQIREKSSVLHLGIAASQSKRNTDSTPGAARIIAWNHRWEYDKYPELFFETLFRLDEENVDFRLIVLGESFRYSPPVFEEAEKRLGHRIEHFGFAESREDYWKLLQASDIIVSTSNHEFFGLSVVEGIAAGCYPLLPMRLSYPEILPLSLHADCFFSTDDEFEERLADLLSAPLPPLETRLGAVAERYLWENRIEDFDNEFETLGELKNSFVSL